MQWRTVKELGPDGLPIELSTVMMIIEGDPATPEKSCETVEAVWKGAGVPQQWKDATIKVVHNIK